MLTTRSHLSGTSLAVDEELERPLGLAREQRRLGGRQALPARAMDRSAVRRRARPGAWAWWAPPGDPAAHSGAHHG
jgi:hypothetical protein